MNPEIHTCDCGFPWRHGQSGVHLCGPYYRKTIAELRAAAPQVVADALAQAKKDAQAWADAEFADAKSLGRGGPGELKRSAAAESKAKASIAALAALASAPVQAAIAPFDRQAFIKGILLSVAEIPDRNSPEDQPEMMLVTGKELSGIIESQFEIVDYEVAPVQPVAVPDGWRLVPIVPTPKMVDSTFNDDMSGLSHNRRNKDIWAAMIAACPAAPAAQGDAKELTDDEIVQAVRSVGVDTHPSKFGFSEEQIEGMSVTVLRQVIAAMAAKAAS